MGVLTTFLIVKRLYVPSGKESATGSRILTVFEVSVQLWETVEPENKQSLAVIAVIVNTVGRIMVIYPLVGTTLPGVK